MLGPAEEEGELLSTPPQPFALYPWSYSGQIYKEVQMDFTPEMEILYILFERCPTKNRKTSLKQHIKYFNLRNKIQLDHSVCVEPGTWGQQNSG